MCMNECVCWGWGHLGWAWFGLGLNSEPTRRETPFSHSLPVWAPSQTGHPRGAASDGVNIGDGKVEKKKILLRMTRTK